MLRAKQVLRGRAADSVRREPDLPPRRVADEEGRGDGDGHDGDDLGWGWAVGWGVQEREQGGGSERSRREREREVRGKGRKKEKRRGVAAGVERRCLFLGASRKRERRDRQLRLLASVFFLVLSFSLRHEENCRRDDEKRQGSSQARECGRSKLRNDFFGRLLFSCRLPRSSPFSSSVFCLSSRFRSSAPVAFLLRSASQVPLCLRAARPPP